MKAAETDLVPSERLFVQVGLRVRIRLPPAGSPMRTSLVGANRGSPPAILLRESYREAGKVKKRTLLNLSDWPHERIAGFKALLKGGTVIPQDQDAITILRSLPHGHVEAVLGTARKIGLDRLLGPDGNRCRDLEPWRAARSRGGRRGRALQRTRLAGGPSAGN